MKLETWQAPPGDEIPNHPSFPVVHFHHFHSTSHEVAGEADDAARERIAGLPAPERDPVGGEGISNWR